MDGGEADKGDKAAEAADTAGEGAVAKRCPKCGAAYPAAFAFCTTDATALVAADGAGKSSDSAGRARGAVIGVVALVVLALLTTVATAVVRGRTASQTASQQPQVSASAGSASATDAASSGAAAPTAESFPGERHPETRTRELTEGEVSGWDCAKVRYAVNEVFARRGYPFKPGKGVHEEFSRFAWYRPEPGLTDAGADERLSGVERANVKLLAARRDALGCGNGNGSVSAGAGGGGGAVGAGGSVVSGWRTVDPEGADVVIGVPADWKADPKLEAKDGLRRWRFVCPEDPWVSLTVDVDERRAGATPMAVWRDLDARFARGFKERYAKIELTPATLDGKEAALWTFRIQRRNEPVLLKKDVTANYESSERGIAIVLAAPPDRFERYRPVFDGAVARFRWAEGD